MKTSLKIEECIMFAFGIFLFNTLDFDWWWFPALLLLPDIGMLGYMVNAKVGAITYNFFHHKGMALVVYMLGFYLKNNILQLIGVIVFAHASLDRIFGYGLKYFDAFKNTHLGQIGK